MRGRQARGAFYALILLLIGVWEGGMAQTIVSTEVQKKRAVLEYFRGIYCVYCPEADEFAAELKADFAEAFIPINIYAGDYSYPMDPYALDLRSAFGQRIHDISGLIGYPAGMVNRRNFPGREQGASGTYAVNRENWAAVVPMILEEDAPVNIGLQAQYDIDSREMEVLIELYYTASVSAPGQSLHIAVLQDSIRTLQAGSTAGFNYFHSNVLRDMITGQDGIEIGPQYTGSLYTQTFQYTLPEELYYTPLEASEIHLVAFVTEDRKNILNAISHTPVSQANKDSDLHLISTYFPSELDCEPWVAPTILVRNDGRQVAENIKVSYTVNDETTQYFDWPGQLKTFEKARISLPTISFSPSSNLTNNLRVELESTVTDENLNNNIQLQSFYSNPITNSRHITLELATDNFGFETYWEIINSNGHVVAQGGNLLVGISGGGKQVGASTNPGVYDNNSTVEVNIQLPGPDCYTFRLIDDYGDGFCCGFGEGYYRLRGELGEILFSGNRFGVTREISFAVESIATATEVIAKEEVFPFQVYPNPVHSEQLAVSFVLLDWQAVHFDLRNASGASLRQGTWQNLSPTLHRKTISLQTLPAGVYFLSLRTGASVSTEKIIRLN